MTITFRVEKPEVGQTKAIVYAMNGEEEVVAGTVRLVEYNNGAIVSPEPFDVNGYKIGTGYRDIEDHIDTVKKAYTNHVDAQAKIEDRYQSSRKLIEFYEVSKEAYFANANIRVYINNIELYNHKLEDATSLYLELHEFSKTEQYQALPTVAMDTINDRIAILKAEVERLQKEQEKEIGYLESTMSSMEGEKL